MKRIKVNICVQAPFFDRKDSENGAFVGRKVVSVKKERRPKKGLPQESKNKIAENF